MLSVKRSSLIALVLIAPAVPAGPITSTVALNGLGSYDGTITYTVNNPTSAKLEISLTNTSPVANGGYLTAFAFNNPSDLITNVSLSSLDNTNFSLLGGTTYQNGINASPYGDFDIGASTGTNWEGGGAPSRGLAVEDSALFTFTLSGSLLDTIEAKSFFNTLSQGTGAGGDYEYFVARFRGFLNDGTNSDKVPGGLKKETGPITTNQTPEPASLVLAGIGVGGMLLHARRVKRRQAAEKLT